MSIITKIPRGTQDITPKDSFKWQAVEKNIRDIAVNYGFSEIRTPVFEHTELFLRSVGDTTDVVQKEMYTFNDKGNRSITLRPEGTAGTARAFIENGLFNNPLPIKLFYFESCYRYEKPQSGRLREFHQFGAELFGAKNPEADAEVICLAKSIFESSIPFDRISLEINSIGCPKCRKDYQTALVSYFESNKDKLCPTCRDRLKTNPMRILDCKDKSCKAVTNTAPVILSFLCDECKEHFEKLQVILEHLSVDFTVNPKIVRGLDYYTKTVFEFIYTDEKGEALTICGGGRYDGLIAELGGNDISALGFGLGLERFLMVLEKEKNSLLSKITPPCCDVYIATISDDFKKNALDLCQRLRDKNIHAECDLVGRGLKAQMKYANKIKARFSLVLGDTEVDSLRATIKNMADSETSEIRLDDNFINDVEALLK